MATRTVDALREHTDADLVPAMAEAEFRSFLADIAARGILEPLEVTRAGVVLDGRHRLRAAQELGIASLPVRVVAPADEVEHMLLGALQRRHLSQSQKACLAVELDDYQQARTEAKLRQRANLNGAEVATLPPRGERSREIAARAAGVSPRIVQDAIAVHEQDSELFARVKAGELPLNRARSELKRNERYAQIAAPPPLPTGAFEVIYADPPWQLGNPQSPYAPEEHYPTLPLEEIKQLTVPAANDALLFLWVPSGLLPAGLDVMAAWGFDYRSNLVWVKDYIGLGQWLRNRHELLLLGRRGKYPLADPADRPDSVIEARRGRHSEKPTGVYELIERMYPHATRLELFARGHARPDWQVWGNEAEAA